jgi:hypothetical protein
MNRGDRFNRCRRAMIAALDEALDAIAGDAAGARSSCWPARGARSAPATTSRDARAHRSSVAAHSVRPLHGDDD